MRELAVELKQLRMHGMAGAWADLVEQGGSAALDSSRWLLEHLLQAETTDRAMRSVSHQMHTAKFPVHRDLDFVNQVQFETLKSLAIETNVTIILIGTYKLLDIRDQSGQLVRRSDMIHLPRYDLRVREDQQNFVQVLKKFEGYFDLASPPVLVKDSNRYFIKTIGCVGTYPGRKRFEAALRAAGTSLMSSSNLGVYRTAILLNVKR